MSTTVQDPIAGALDEVERWAQAKTQALDRLALQVVEARDAGASVRALAKRYDIPPSQVHALTTRGRELRCAGRRAAPSWPSTALDAERAAGRATWAAILAALAAIVCLLASVAPAAERLAMFL
jgi:hypothetical protein